MTDFGTRLKQARKKKKMTQKQLAQKLGVEQSAISNYEKNLRAPAAGALIQIANLLDISIDDLLGRTIAAENNTLSSSHLQQQPIDYKNIQILFLQHLLEQEEVKAQKLVMNHFQGAHSLLPLFTDVLVPTLMEVGVLWEKGKIDVTLEHLISHMVDRLISSLESLLPDPPFIECSAMFMLPGAEEHQLTLKMAKLLFKSKGWRTYYIGRSIPMSSLEIFLSEIKVDLLVMSVTLDKHLNSAEHLIRALKSLTTKNATKVVIGGSAIMNRQHALQQLGADEYAPTLTALDQLIKQHASCA